MSLIALTTAALLGGLFHPAPKPTTPQVYGEGEWRLTVITDTFTHQVRCTLENHNGRHPDVVAVPGALAFRFGREVDTSDVWYRIDDQPAKPWRDLRAELVAAGSLSEAERLDNALDGVVLIPLEALQGAKVTTMQSTTPVPPRTFALDSFWTTLASAKGLGCRFGSDLGPSKNVEPSRISTIRRVYNFGFR